MEYSTLILTLWSALLANAVSTENIQISTTSSTPVSTSTFNPYMGKTTESNEDENSFLKSVEDFLSNRKVNQKSDSEHQIQGYIPNQMIPVYPAYNSGGYFYPGVNPNAVQTQSNTDIQNSNYFSAVLPAAQMGFEIVRNLFLYFLVRHFVLKLIKLFDLVLDIREVLLSDETSMYITKAALQAGFKLFAKMGIFVVGGAALLIVGGLFTTLVCRLTPLCNITFYGYDLRGVSKETVRSLMTPEKIASAAALVQDAIGKYQRLQRAVGQ